MCTFNGEKFLEEQLHSILNQTYPIGEIIVVDDRSQDQTLSIIQSLAEKDTRIRFFLNESRLGATKNFEKAFLLARNEWIAVADQDDVWHPQKIEKLSNSVNNKSLLIYCDSQRFHEQPDFSVRPHPNYRRFEGTDGRNIFLFNTVSGHAMLFHKKLLDLKLPFSNNVYYDWLLAVTAAYNGGVVYIPETLVLQRIHDKNLSNDESSQYDSPVTRLKFKKMVLAHLQVFAETPNMPSQHHQMVVRLLDLWRDSIENGFSFGLFLFLMKYRKHLYAFKKKKSLFFRHLKYSWWFCKN